MALTTEEVDDLMHCNCDAEVKALDFDITANRRSSSAPDAVKWYRCPVISTGFRMYGMPKQSDWSKTNRRTANETSIQSPFRNATNHCKE